MTRRRNHCIPGIQSAEIIKYRWEFIRLNQNYLNAYRAHKQYVCELIKKGYKEINSDYYENCSQGRHAVNVHGGCHVFQLKRYFDPKFSFEDLQKKFSELEFYFDVGEPVMIEVGDGKLKFLKNLSEVEAGDFPSSFVNLKLWVDLKGKELRTKNLIVDFIDKLRVKSSLKHVQEISRNRFLEYEDYLRIYYKMLEYNNIRKVAKLLYKRDWERDVNYALKKAKRHYESAKNMIDGGYRQIR
jgi:hypothetical protein